jgi:outer membrane protein assembly factor BamB
LCLSLLTAGTTIAQQFQFGFATPTAAELTPPRVDIVSGPTAARLEQARALAADKNWEEVVDIYRQLIAGDTGRVVALGDGLYLSLRTYCQLQLARLPAEALAIYRRQVDPLAEQWYRDGVSQRDEQQLRRLASEFFCSSWGDDALLALGELALERAHYAAARRWWLEISPLLRSPTGRPLWLALRDVDLNAHWPGVARRWNQRLEPPDWLAYPDTQLDLAGVRARLVLASIRAGQRDRAALELDAFRRLHPEATGRLGGQEGQYAAALERLLTSAGEWSAEQHESDWSTFAGSTSRSSVAAALGPTLRPSWALSVPLARSLGNEHETSQVAVRESQRPLSCFPITVDRTLVFADARGIHAVDLATGAPAITSDGVLHRNEPLEGPNLEIRFSAGPAAGQGVLRDTLTAVDGVVYRRVGRPATTRLDAGQTAPVDWLVGLDLSRDGLLTFRRRPEDASWSFDGGPVSDGRRVFVAMRHSDVTPQAYVACFDASTQAQLWRTPIGTADTPAAGRDEITNNLLTLVDDRVYFNSNLGLVAALDVEDGKICWLHRYERLRGNLFAAGQPGPLHFDRDLSPCLYYEGMLIIAPSDAPTIFALDAHTGQRSWATEKLSDGLHLLGVVQQNLIIGGNRLWALDVRSGGVRFVWPESEHAGIRGMGRGVIAGEEVFWPTRDEIYVVHAVTGERTRLPIDLAPIVGHGANLAAARGHLIVAGYDKLMAFGPPSSTLNPDP